MAGQSSPQLVRLIVTPFVTIGVLSAVMVWELEHVGSILLAVAVAAGAIVVGVTVSRQLRTDIARVSDYYANLLRIAEEQSRQADAANRLKDQFLTTLSHELRTPLNSILGWARLLESGKLDAEQSAHAIQAIERAGWSQARLIEDLLDLSHIVSGSLELTIEPTPLAPLVETAVNSLRHAAEAKRITIGLSFDPALEPIAADAIRLKQVVWNLVSNAIKFTPVGGRVDVRLSAVGGDVLLTVRDSGIGLDPDVAAHLFERFRQGDSSSTRQHGGLGLGLSIVRHVVELHGGMVTASSEGDSEGSTFEVRLPIRVIDAPVAETLPTLPATPTLRGLRVLAVDNDPRTLQFIRETLERYGAVVVTATSLTEATARFQRDPPDVILSDLVLNGEDGLSLIRDIRRLDRETGRATPAGALTYLARSEDRRQALLAGYQIHVAKPVEPSELVSTIEWLAHAPVDQTASGDRVQ